MTAPDELRVAAAAHDEGAIRAILSPLPEDDRADLAPIAREVVRTEVAHGLEARHLEPMLVLAYGLLPVTEIRKLGWRSRHLRTDFADILRRRSPERLGPIVEHLLENVGGEAAWRTVRPLVRDGVIERPATPAYTIAMLTTTRWRPASELLAADPSLLDVEAWRLFEVEGGGEDSLANYEKFYGDTWGDAFRALAAADSRMRDRLLDASLAALGRDFSAYRAGWFSRFHESLAPTDGERAARADSYLGLLRSRVGPTVSFAVVALKRIERAGMLPGSTLLDRIGPVLTEASAGTAKAALDLVGAAGTRSPGEAERAALVAVEAMRHPAVDVQRAAIALVSRLAAAPDVEVAAAVVDRLPDVAASQRSDAAALVERLAGEAALAPPARPIAPAPPLEATSVARSPTDPSRALEPIETLEELVDVAVSVIETGEPADDLERVLDAVRRFGHRESPAFARLTAPIARRARTLLKRRESIPFNGFDARSDIAALLLAWATGEVTPSAEIHSSVNPGAGAFLSARAREAAEDVARGESRPSVALPTHRGGWIEPAALVERLGRHPPASTLDFVAAILRLAGDGRPMALKAARELAGEVGAVVRYALGGEEAIGKTASWWVAAGRVRAPGFDDVAVARRHGDLGPEAARAATTSLRIVRPRGTYEELILDVQPPPQDGTPLEMPTALMLRNPSVMTWTGRSDAVMTRWIATIQPGYREVWAAIGSLLIGRNLDWWSAEWGNRAFLEPFLDPWTDLESHAIELIGIALGAKEAGERGLASDVARLAIAGGRLEAAGLARGFAAAATLKLDRPQRWAQSLADVAADSDRHTGVVAESIARSLGAVRERPGASLVPVLRLLDELLAETGSRVVEAAHPDLEALGSLGGQAGRLARSILARGDSGVG